MVDDGINLPVIDLCCHRRERGFVSPQNLREKRGLREVRTTRRRGQQPPFFSHGTCPRKGRVEAVGMETWVTFFVIF